jgi:uncharacterized protein YlxW (UPF0749 family)
VERLAAAAVTIRCAFIVASELAPMLLNEMQQEQRRIVAQAAEIRDLTARVAQLRDVQQQMAALRVAVTKLQAAGEYSVQR